METRAAKRRAGAATMVLIDNQELKKQRVVLGELPNLPNLIVPSTFNKCTRKPQCLKNPNIKKQAHTNSTLSSSPDANLHDLQTGEPYASDIHHHLRAMEIQKKRRPTIDYMEKVQKEVTATMRGILVDWLVEVADEYQLLPDTLHLTVSYIDRYLSVKPVSKLKFQLLGVSSMFVASKYEEINPPCAEKFCSITDNTYDAAEVIRMESDILKILNYEMGNPTVNTFLSFAMVASEDQKVEFIGSYLAELSLLDYDCLRFLPSIVAASAIFLARFIIRPGVHPWTLSLCECTGHKSVELKECVLILYDLYLSIKASYFQAIRDKYKQHKFKCVANLPVPSCIPNNYFEDQ